MQETPSGGDRGRIDINETDARQARSVGLIWMLAVSLTAGVIVLGLVLVIFSGSLGLANHRGGPTAVAKAQAAQFHAPA